MLIDDGISVMASRSILNHEVTGDGRKNGLLLLHPLGANRHFWDACVETWRGHLSCVAADLRNVVTDGSEARPVTIEQHVADLKDLQNHLGFERLVPVGCAVSTMIAAGYAAICPERVAALVLSNATARSSPQASVMLVERAKLVRQRGIAAILPQAVQRAFLNQRHDERYQRYFDAFASQPAIDYAFACEASAAYNAESYLKVVGCPALVVAGQHDVLLPPALAEEVTQILPDARLRVIDAAHFVPYQAPSAFATLVLDFLKEVGVSNVTA
jgi:pimeloyl-ACP methyl ester carboxylesterase